MQKSRFADCTVKKNDFQNLGGVNHILNIEVALSERLRHLGFIFRSPPPTFVKIVPGPFYQLSHFWMLFIENLTCKTRHFELLCL